MHRIIVVLVTYFPAMELLRANLLTLAGLGLRVVLFDNSPLPSSGERRVVDTLRNNSDFSEIEFQGQGENIGLSKAYNKVVKQFLNDPEIDAFLFLDQDSSVLRASVLRLVESFYTISQSGRLGVLGGYPLKNDQQPCATDSARHANKICYGCYETNMVPSSFSMIPAQVFRDIGTFYDDFFIDHIDMDFCFRARRAGLLVVIDAQAPFPHSVGCGNIILCGKYITPVSAPFRHYFQIRNSILSFRRTGYSFRGLVFEISKRVAMVALQSLLKGSLPDRCRYACRGFFDGIRGIGGNIPPDLITKQK